jgi:cobaltochelatase CobS
LSESARLKLQEVESASRNELIDYDIKKTFGIEVSKNVKTIKGFRHPHPNTPKIDPDYQFRKDQLMAILFERLNADAEKVLFTGPTGSGKTSALEQVAARLNLPFFRINMDNDVTRADFVGQWVVKGDDMDYLYGILPRAMKTPMAILVVDEWDCVNPGCGMALQAVLEGKPLTIAELATEVFPAQGFTLYCTANTIGQGDETGLYAGTQVQNFAQLDRFTMVIQVDYPDAMFEKMIWQKKCGLTYAALMQRFGVTELKNGDDADSMIHRLIETARLTREAFLKEEITATMSTRTLVNIANKMLVFGNVKMAYGLCYLNKLNREDRQFVEEIVQRVWGV